MIFNQSVINSVRMIVIIFLPGFTTIILVGLFRVNDTHPNQGACVPQISFIFIIFLIHLLNGVHPSLIKSVSTKLDKAWAQSIGNAFSNPYPDLGVTLHRIFPPISFLDTNAKNSNLRFHTHGSAKFFCMLAIGPRWDYPTARLLVGKEEIGILSGNEFVGKSIWDISCRRFLLSDLCVPQKPQFF